MRKELIIKKLVHFCLLIILFIILYPIYITFVHSFMGVREIEVNMGGIISGYTDILKLSILPSYPTLDSYKKVLLYADKFFLMFWNSCLYSASTVAGQIIIAAPAAFFIARYKFKGKKLIFWLYIAVMLMPFQVVMVSEYFVLKQIGIINTQLAIILPGIFGTFPVFILSKVYETIEEEIIDAAKVDGANSLTVFLKICMPIGKGGIISVSVLSFLEFFNIIEQPLIFLQNRNLWPLSLFFPKISLYNAGEVFAASIIIMIPAVLVFFIGEESLEEGMKAFEVKG